MITKASHKTGAQSPARLRKLVCRFCRMKAQVKSIKPMVNSPTLLLVLSIVLIAISGIRVYGADTATKSVSTASSWKIGTPIVTYWAGPGYPGGSPMNDAAAEQLVEGGWNLVWCHEKELDVAQRHGLRGLLYDPLLNPAALDNPKQREALDALINRVRQHPSLYAYFIVDEPNASAFPALGKLVAYLRERDPSHLAYINLFPTYASNEQLGTKGDRITAYKEYLRQFVEVVRPSLLSYDHYQFMNGGDTPEYFLNLALIREKALESGLLFLNIVQASCWVPNSAGSPHAPRVPNGDEMRYLVYTTLAYGAQGISYYVYCYPNHEGGIARADGTPTPLYHALKSLNREFVAIAKELQSLISLGVYHAGMQPPGAVPLPKDSVFTFDAPVSPIPYKPGERVRGLLLSEFGLRGKTNTMVTHALIVNLDYKTEQVVKLNGPAQLEVFDAMEGKWLSVDGKSAELHLMRGGGKLVRVRQSDKN